MITVNVKYANDTLTKLVISGHALSAEPGKDLVCAGVSAVAVGALNSLEAVDASFEIVMKDGYIKVVPQHVMSPHNTTVLNVLVTSLKTITQSYGEYIQINEERNVIS